MSAPMPDWLGSHDNATSFLYCETEGASTAVRPALTAKRHLLTISDIPKTELRHILRLAGAMKQARADSRCRGTPDEFREVLQGRSLLTLFEKPSLRTRVSLDLALKELGGFHIAYSTADSPLGAKETLADMANVLSKYCDGIAARVAHRTSLWELASVAAVPVLNALDDFAHPMQMVADILTIRECCGKIRGVKLAYLGDLQNNVTYDLMRTCATLGITLQMSGSGHIEENVWEECRNLQGNQTLVRRVATATDAVRGVDVIYTDSWMSYGVPSEELETRKQRFAPFQVTTELLALAAPGCIFMNCLPAARGMEQTAEVIDGEQSVVFQQAENRLHAQKALLTWCLNPTAFENCLHSLRAQSKWEDQDW